MKQNKIVLLTLFCVFAFAKANAQTQEVQRERIIGLKIGYDQSYFKDLNFSPLNYTGKGLVIGLEYWKTIKSENLIFSKLDFSINTLEADAFPDYNDRYLANIEIGYLKNIKMANEKLKLHLGGQYHTYIDAVFYDGTESITFFTVHGIDVSGLLSFAINDKHQLQTSISIPVFGFLVRPPYTGWDKFIIENEDSPAKIFFRGNWTSINNYQAVNWTTNYNYSLSPKWDFTAQYRFRYYRTKQLDLAKIATNQFSLGINLKF